MAKKSIPNRFINYLLVGVLIVAFIIILGGRYKQNSEVISQDEVFQKDEYCKTTYSDPFIKNFERKLIGMGKNGAESEYIKLVDIFFSFSKNKCIAVYDYYYFNFTEFPGNDGKTINISLFERRIADAISADIVIDDFKITPGGNFEDFAETERYNNVVKDLKGIK